MIIHPFVDRFTVGMQCIYYSYIYIYNYYEFLQTLLLHHLLHSFSPPLPPTPRCLLPERLNRLSTPCLPFNYSRRLREKGYTGLIVGLVGDAGPESRDRLLFQEQGADAVLPKPFNLTALDDIVRQYVDRKR